MGNLGGFSNTLDVQHIPSRDETKTNDRCKFCLNVIAENNFTV